MINDLVICVSVWRRFARYLLVLAAIFCFRDRLCADEVAFTTESTATQTLSSGLFGTVQISAIGRQMFNLDPDTGFADVESLFQGSDLPDPLNPGGFLNYDLYNTKTFGEVFENSDGFYDVVFNVLFELKITSGIFTGLTFETLDLSFFGSLDIESLPFPPGTVFYSPDPTAIYVQFDPTGTFPPGTLVGSSYDRFVTINRIVPEPNSAIIASAFLGLAVVFRRKKILRDQLWGIWNRQ